MFPQYCLYGEAKNSWGSSWLHHTDSTVQNHVYVYIMSEWIFKQPVHSPHMKVDSYEGSFQSTHCVVKPRTPGAESRICLYQELTHWGPVTDICVSKLTTIGSDNGLSFGRRQAIIWTNAGIFLIGPLGTNFNETSIEIHTFSFKKIDLKLSSGKWRPFCLSLYVLTGFTSIFCIAHA